MSKYNMRKNKYNNITTCIDNISFKSKKEAARYCELKLLLKSGKICNLVCQPGFELIVNGHKIGKYIADFQYQIKNGKKITEDVKGILTTTYRLKKKLMKAIYGIDIYET